MTITAAANPFNLDSFDVDQPTARYMTVSEDGKTYRILVALPPDPQRLMCHCLFVGGGERLEQHEIGSFATFEAGEQLMFWVGVELDGGSVLQAPSDDRNPPLLVVDGKPDEKLVLLDIAEFKLTFYPHLTVEALTVPVPQEILQDLDGSARAYQQVRAQRDDSGHGMDSAYACQMVIAYNRLHTRVIAGLPPRPGDTAVPYWLVSNIRMPVEAYRACQVPDERWEYCDQVAEAIMQLLDLVGYKRRS